MLSPMFTTPLVVLSVIVTELRPLKSTTALLPLVVVCVVLSRIWNWPPAAGLFTTSEPPPEAVRRGVVMAPFNSPTTTLPLIVSVLPDPIRIWFGVVLSLCTVSEPMVWLKPVRSRIAWVEETPVRLLPRTTFVVVGRALSAPVFSVPLVMVVGPA